MKNILLRSGLVFLIISGFSLSLFATHNRAGEITWTHVVDLTYEFTITTYTDPNSLADRDALYIYWGDGDGSGDTLFRNSIETLTDYLSLIHI